MVIMRVISNGRRAKFLVRSRVDQDRITNPRPQPRSTMSSLLRRRERRKRKLNQMKMIREGIRAGM